MIARMSALLERAVTAGGAGTGQSSRRKEIMEEVC
jgi:hypothetical protein